MYLTESNFIHDIAIYMIYIWNLHAATISYISFRTDLKRFK